MYKFPGYPVFAVALALFGCVSTALVNPGVAVLGGLELETSQSWTAGSSANTDYWTQDGILLNSVSVTQIRSGQHILGVAFDSNSKTEDWQKKVFEPFVWTPASTLEASMEKHLGALGVNGKFNVSVITSSTSSISGYPAIEFEFTHETGNNLRYRSLARFAVKENVLYKVILSAPEESYYQKLELEFRQILRSASFSDSE